jgi:hypothetical protein
VVSDAHMRRGTPKQPKSANNITRRLGEEDARSDDGQWKYLIHGGAGDGSSGEEGRSNIPIVARRGEKRRVATKGGV